MVKQHIAFDCIRMKDEIQSRILESERPLSLDEIRRKREAEIREDAILGPWLKRIPSFQQNPRKPSDT